MKNMLRMMALVVALMGAGNAHAEVPAVPVIDAIAAFMKTAFDETTKAVKWAADKLHDAAVEAHQWAEKQQWLKDLAEMQKQLNQLKEMTDLMNGITSISTYKNMLTDPRKWGYLPDDYNDVVKNGIGNSSSIADFISSEVGMSPDELIESNTEQAAISRGIGDLAYSQASTRRIELQTLMQTIKSETSSSKEKQDAMVRLLAEQTMLQNELIKLQAINLLNTAQEQLDDVRKRQQIAKKLDTSIL